MRSMSSAADARAKRGSMLTTIRSLSCLRKVDLRDVRELYPAKESSGLLAASEVDFREMATVLEEHRRRTARLHFGAGSQHGTIATGSQRRRGGRADDLSELGL